VSSHYRTNRSFKDLLDYEEKTVEDLQLDFGGVRANEHCLKALLKGDLEGKNGLSSYWTR
jgi:hypothetical protein